jgi:hypothetical protein
MRRLTVANKLQQRFDIFGPEIEVVGNIFDTLACVKIIDHLLCGHARTTDDRGTTHPARNDLDDFAARPVRKLFLRFYASMRLSRPNRWRKDLLRGRWLTGSPSLPPIPRRRSTCR